MEINVAVTEKQKRFIDSNESEVLFGGAAGGGKSYGQIVDALLFALKYPGSKQLVLRRTFAELDKSLIRTSLALFPKDIYSFNSSTHTGKFKNSSIIDFGYCGTENDVYQYQSAEYDLIRFDELTHFTEAQYIYLISRVRGANSYPKQIKSTTNPGGVGHSWVKARFIDPAPSGESFVGGDGLKRIPNTLIYGHHMRDSSMFHSLTDYETEGFFEAHPFMVIVDKDEIYVVEVFAGYVTDSSDHCYDIAISDEEDMRNYTNAAKKKSDFDSHVQIDCKKDHVVTLSTCAYHFDNARYIVIGRLDLAWERYPTFVPQDVRPTATPAAQ